MVKANSIDWTSSLVFRQPGKDKIFRGCSEDIKHTKFVSKIDVELEGVVGLLKNFQRCEARGSE